MEAGGGEEGRIETGETVCIETFHTVSGGAVVAADGGIGTG